MEFYSAPHQRNMQAQQYKDGSQQTSATRFQYRIRLLLHYVVTFVMHQLFLIEFAHLIW